MITKNKTVYKDPWVTVSKQEWSNLDHPYTVVKPRTGLGACVIPIRFVNREPEVLLVAQPRVPNGSILWDVPAGGVDEGEEPAVAAVRELFEETNIKITVNDLTFLGVKQMFPHIMDETLSIYYTVLPKNYGFETIHPENEDEISDIAWVKVETVYRRAAEDSSYDFMLISKLFLAQRVGLFRKP